MPSKPTCEDLERRILELEEVENRLKETEQLLADEVAWRRLLVEESRDAIVVIDQQAKVFEANSQFAEMLGYTKEEVYKLHVWDWEANFTKEQILEMAKTVDNLGHQFETLHRRKDGSIVHVELSNNGALYRGKKLIFCICRDITERKKAEIEREELIEKLRESLGEIKTLRNIVPICSFCKKIRDDKGYWEQVDVYINKHFKTDLSHGICPDCFKKNYPEEYSETFPEETN